MSDWLIVLVPVLVLVAVGLWIIFRWSGNKRPSADEVMSELIVPRASVLARLDFDVSPGQIFLTAPEVVIGRHSDDDILINDVRVSRSHARLRAVNGKFEIENLTVARESPNTLLVNGTAKEHAFLFDGDVVTLGGVNFAFHKGAAS